MDDIKLVQNLEDHLEVHLSAAIWRSKNCPVYSKVWDPELYCKQSYLEEFYEEQAFTLYINGLPSAAVVMYGEGQAKYSKEANVKNPNRIKDSKILYIDDLAVKEDLIGKGIFAELLQKINEYAREQGYEVLRMDTDKRLVSLVNCYLRNGFIIVSEDCDEHEERTSVFFEKNVL